MDIDVVVRNRTRNVALYRHIMYMEEKNKTCRNAKIFVKRPNLPNAWSKLKEVEQVIKLDLQTWLNISLN